MGIGKLFQDARKKKGWKIVDVARQAIGKECKNIRVLQCIESGGDVFPAKVFRDRFAEVLGLCEEEILLAMSEDFTALDMPIPPVAVVKIMPCVYQELKLPENCSQEEAIEIAKRHSIEHGKSTCVRLSEIRTCYISPAGRSCEGYSVPQSTLAGVLGIPTFLSPKLRQGLNKVLGKTVIESQNKTGK